MTNKLPQRTSLILVYITSLLYSFSSSLPVYVNSSFIAKVISVEKAVGIIFAISAAVSVCLTLFLPYILKRFGCYKTIISIIALEVLLFVGMATLKSPIAIIIVFILNQSFLSILAICLSIFLENFSENSETGGIRGIFLTTINTAVIIGPFLAGMMIGNGGFGKVYLAAAIFMLAAYIIMSMNFKNYKDPLYKTLSLRETFGIVVKSHDIHAIVCVHFLLNFFFTIMVIYTPIYLNVYMGIPMNKILSIVIPIALVPFALFEAVLGEIADKKLGEKEIMIAGFVIIVFFTAMLSFITNPSIIVWAIVLFLTRVGASAVEVMSETYFYKKINPNDIHLVSFLYVVRSGASILAPLIVVFILYFLDYRYIFLILSIIMILGIPYSFHFKDTR
ncbi:MAG: MFS transporter [Candidatus Pacebacteria bacterium]|nr:MFS transporter [Candidatus Paceibacterota bacterium]